MPLLKDPEKMKDASLEVPDEGVPEVDKIPNKGEPFGLNEVEANVQADGTTKKIDEQVNLTPILRPTKALCFRQNNKQPT